MFKKRRRRLQWSFRYNIQPFSTSRGAEMRQSRQFAVSSSSDNDAGEEVEKVRVNAGFCIFLRWKELVSSIRSVHTCPTGSRHALEYLDDEEKRTADNGGGGGWRMRRCTGSIPSIPMCAAPPMDKR